MVKPTKKRKENIKNKKKKCEEEITEEERLEDFGIFQDDKKDEDNSEDESWKNYT